MKEAMKQDLDSLRREIDQYLEENGFGVFHASSREPFETDVYWDTDAHPDFKEFLTAAQRAGVRLMVVRTERFGGVEDALENLEMCEMPREEYRTCERRLKELGGYEGFTCEVELSFDLSGMTYFFAKRAPWYVEYLDMAEDISVLGGSVEDDEEEDDDSSIGGYFSRN
jgi:hypothetical protein